MFYFRHVSRDWQLGSKLNSACVLILWEITWKFHTDRIIFTQVLARHSQNPFTWLSHKRVDKSPQNLMRRNAPYNRTCPMPLKFQLDRLPLTPVRVRRKSYSKTDRKTDTHADTQTYRGIVQKHFSRRFDDCTSPIRSYVQLGFLDNANNFMGHKVISRNLSHPTKHFWSLIKP